MLADHNFPVFELERVGVTGFGNGIDLGPFGKVREDGVQRRITENSQIGHLHSKARERIGHDRPIAAEFGELADQFDIRALPGGSGEALSEFGDGGQALIFFSALSLIYHVQDVIDKAIESDEGGHAGGARSGFRKFRCAALAHFRGIHVGCD